MTKIQNPKRFEHLNFDIASNFDIRISSLIFYLLILFLPTQLGRHFWPDFSFVSGVRVDYLSPTIYATDILILLLFITWILNLLGRHSGKRSASRISMVWRDSGQARMTDKHMWKENFNPFDPLRREASKLRVDADRSRSIKFQIALVLIALAIGIVFSKNQPAGLYGFIKLLEFIFLGFYTAANFKKLKFNVVLALFSISIIFESFLAILQYFNQGSIGSVFYWFGERTFNPQTPGIANASVNGELILRPYATFSHPNVLAGYLLIGMALVLGRIMNYESRIKRIAFILTLTIGTTVLFLTLSRVAILIWLITLGVILFRKFLNHKSYILILLGVLLILGLVTPLGARFANLTLTDESIVIRGELIKSSLLMIKDNPFFGVGLNNFLVELPKYQKINNYFTDLQPAHNIYLLILAQTGIAGFAFFAWFLIKTYRFINHKSYILILLTSVLTLGMFDHYFLTLQQGQLLFSLILGLCWAKFPSQKSLH